jgi:hypothetical protein
MLAIRTESKAIHEHRDKGKRLNSDCKPWIEFIETVIDCASRPVE